ncbi:PEP-CTERM/exosortase system-associated acyltransferase [Pelagibius marinus]|uniref:PEP-CTERM/exosortase system-associated acyltransferase n=1 Tax=Pelagibius marinus TaxID=2762760 RepID=UPI00187289B0|nr:PEP-CTERM/exosortase system-associated acyltransferase [Pelagibius marinus]
MAPEKVTPTPPGAGPKRNVAMPPARDSYRQYFETVVVGEEDDALRDAAFRLRYQVYCIENPFEDPADNPDGRERDTYDERAVHCLLLHLPTHSWAGAVRLILPDQNAPEHSFALQQVCTDPTIFQPELFPVQEMGEISRFCISKEFRKRQGDWLYPRSNEPEQREHQRRIIPNMTLGLIEGLVQISLDHGIYYWCAVMERPLLRLLARLGIHFKDIGPLVDYHGHRQPCLIKLDTMLTQVQTERPDVWDILTDGGQHWDRLVSLQSGRSE